jgi:hypothetical protein
MVTGLRALAGGVPKGECELQRTVTVGSAVHDSNGDGEAAGRPALLKAVLMVCMFTAARDSGGWPWSWRGRDFPNRGLWGDSE